MFPFSKVSIGFLLAPGFRQTDVILTQGIIGAPPRHKCYYIAEQEELVVGGYGFSIRANCTYDSCPPLDVLVVGEVPDEQLEDACYIDFIRSQVQSARHVIAASNGVVALAKAGVLAGKQVTADRANLEKLAQFGAEVVDRGESVVDGKFYTSGPSTGMVESAFKVMRKLTGDAVTSIFELTIEYDPKPLYSNLGSDTALQDTLQGIKPLKVAVLTPPDLYVPDVSGSIDVLGSIPGSEIFYVWKEKGKCQGILGPELYADTTFEECPPVDVVVIGAVHPNLSKDVGAQDFLLQQEKQGASMIAVCEGALMLGSTGLLKGRHAVTNFHMVNLLRLADAIPSTKEVVVVDGKFYTAGPVMGAYEAAIMYLKDTYGDDVARYIEQSVLEYEPNPVLGVGSPELAGKVRTFVSRALVYPAVMIYGSGLKKGYRRRTELAAA